jgi:hypothetical protein
MLWLIWRSWNLEDENAMEKGKVSARRLMGVSAHENVMAMNNEDGSGE